MEILAPIITMYIAQAWIKNSSGLYSSFPQHDFHQSLNEKLVEIPFIPENPIISIE